MVTEEDKEKRASEGAVDRVSCALLKPHPALGRPRQENHMFEGSSHTASSCLGKEKGGTVWLLQRG